MRGYIAIYEKGKILSYTDKKHRSIICSENQGSRIKFIEGKKDKLELENWIISRGDYRYKVDIYGSTYYFSTRIEAKEYADRYGLNCEKLNLGVNIYNKGGYLIKVERSDSKLLDLEKEIDCMLDDIELIVSRLLDIRDKMYSELSIQDKKIVCIEHIMEFNTNNKHDGNKLYKIMQENLLERRRVKDKIRYLDIVLENKTGNISKNKVNEKVVRSRGRTYNPRVLEDLFSIDNKV